MIIRKKITERRDLTLIVPDGLGLEVQMHGDTVELKASPVGCENPFAPKPHADKAALNCPLVDVRTQAHRVANRVRHKLRDLKKYMG